MALGRIRKQPKRRQGPEAPRAAAVAPTGEVDRRFKRHYWRLGRVLLGKDAMAGSWQKSKYDDAQAAEIEEQARLAAAFATFGRLVAAGQDPETAHVATVRALAAAGHRVLARAYCEGIGPVVSEDIARVALGVCLYRLRRYDVVWEQFVGVDPAVLARHALVEAVDSALSTRTPEAAAVARAVVADPSFAETAALPRLAGRFLVAGHPDVARGLYDEANARADLDEKSQRPLENLARWLEEPAGVPEPPAGRLRIGVFDYHHPDLVHAAGNVGDHIQTLSLLGNLARFQNVRFHGAGGVGEFAEGLRDRVRPELRLDGPDADVELLPVSRDYSEGDPIPEDTWIVAFGWHMHGLYRIRFGLPYHPNIRPVFVAFHLNRVQALTPEAIDYLRAHGPVGCRDWTTVDLLLSAGVDAFFTGCITSTVNAVFPDRETSSGTTPPWSPPSTSRPQSVQANRPVEEITHLVSSTQRSTSPRPPLGRRAPRHYLRRYHRIVTSRLHSYLPATSLGVPVTFRPNVPGDVRFAGLRPGARRAAFDAMRDGIRELLAETFGLVLAGASMRGLRPLAPAHRGLGSPRPGPGSRPRTSPPRSVSTSPPRSPIRASIDRLGPHDPVDPAAVSDIAVASTRTRPSCR